MKRQQIRVLRELGESFERLAANGGVAPPSRLRAWLRTAPVVASVLVAIAIAGGALLLLGRGGAGGSSVPTSRSPFAGGPASIAQEARYIERAAQQVRAQPACRPARVAREPALLQGAPSAALLSELGVLRRPANAADRQPAGLLSGMAGVYGSYVRQALVRGGFSYWITPERSEPQGYSRACAALEKAALRRELRQIPPRLRAPTMAMNARLIAVDASSRPTDVVCLEYHGPTSGGGACGSSAARIARIGSEVTRTSAGTLAGIVPDGVASVALQFPAADGLAALSVTTSVRDNVFAVAVARARSGHYPSTIVWRSAGGRVIRRVPESATGSMSASAFCRHNPAACRPQRDFGSASMSASAAAPSTTGH